MMEETAVVVVRAIITFFSLLIYTRILGKQQMGNLSFFDYINGITIGSIGASLATDLSTKAWVHWVGLTTFILIALGLQFGTLKNRNLSKVVTSDPIVVIQQAKILEKNLNKMRVTKDELMVLLRQKDIFDITQVEFAILEPNGKVSVLLKSEFRPVTNYDMDHHVPKSNLTVDVVYDGIILQKNLEQRKKDVDWLYEQIKKQGTQKVKDIAYAGILPNNKLYIDLFEDKISDKKATNLNDNEKESN